MTLLGKLFLMLNLAMSLMLATVAFGVFATGTDFSEQQAKGTRMAGQLALKKKELADLLDRQGDRGPAKSYDTAWRGWDNAQLALVQLEESRRADRALFVAELQKLITGMDKVQEVDRAAEAKLEGDREQKRQAPAGLPPMTDAKDASGADLMPLPFYVSKLADLRKENSDKRAQIEAKVQEDTTLTAQLVGDAPRARGLNRELEDERHKKQGIVDEQGIVAGTQINAEVDSELIFKRLQTLEERIAELTGYLKRKHNVDVPARGR